MLKSQVLSSECNSERVRDDASGDSEDCEDDELPSSMCATLYSLNRCILFSVFYVLPSGVINDDKR